MTTNPWKRLNRKLAYDSKFVKVYEDSVRLPNGSVVDDYTVVEKKDIVMIVATDIAGKIIVIDEYKYAIDCVTPTLPAGALKKDEDPVTCAIRELREETGYSSVSAKLVTTVHDYPSKDLHKVFVVRIENASKSVDTDLESTESISCKLLDLPSLKKEILSGTWKGTSSIASLAVCGLL